MSTKIWALWVGVGDKNSKFFRRFASMRRKVNVIWSIYDERDTLYTSQLEIEHVASCFLKDLFFAKDLEFQAQIYFISKFPMLTQEPENDILSRSVLKEELHNFLLACGREIILGLDGWGVELYINLFELMSLELLAMAEESRVKGHIIRTINATFIALIPKNKLPITFKD